jgi:hypothetical protein
MHKLCLIRNIVSIVTNGLVIKGRSVSLLIKIDIINAYLLMMFVVVFVVNFLDFE